jgi:anti-sigma B factor antagonist
MHLNVVSTSDSTVHVELIGNLDALGVEDIRDEFAKATDSLDHHIVIDIHRMPYIASLGIAMLVSTAQIQKKRGLKVVLIAPTADVEQMLKQLKINQVMPVYPNLSEAISAVGQV